MGEESKPAGKVPPPEDADQKTLNESSGKKPEPERNMIEIDVLDEEPPAPIVAVRKHQG